MLRRFHWLPILLVAVGLLASLGALGLRYKAESRSRAVDLVLDYGQFRSLVTATGVPVSRAFHSFQSAGITGIALTEETLADLQNTGMLDVKTQAVAGAREYHLTFTSPSVAQRVAECVRQLLPQTTREVPTGARVVLTLPSGPVYIPGRFDELRTLPIGIDPVEVAEVKAAGLEPVGRINNPLALTPTSLRWVLERLKRQGIRTVVFAGEEVLGYRKLIKETARVFRELDLVYGSVEFGKQRGDEGLSRELLDKLVRVHSISQAEMARLPDSEAIERYVRAAVERNIRVNYVRLPGNPTGRTFEDSVEYVHDLSRDLAKAGFGISDKIVPFGYVWPSEMVGRLGRACIALGVGAGAVLLLALLVPLRPRGQAVLALVAAGFCAVLVLTGKTLFLQLVALLAAVTFPSLAFLLIPQPVGAFEDHEYVAARNRRQAVVPAVAEFATISAITLVGTAMVAGLLSELSFMVKVDSFAGIKAATVVPLFIVSLAYLTGMTGEYPSWRLEWRALKNRTRAFMDEPLRVWHTVAMVAGLMVLALLVLRSGNDPGVGVSDSELRFRALLDRVLGVRPRTKEFLMGHPALLLGLAMATLPRWRKVALPLVLVGIIGQVGMLNSFCHLHSPLRLTVLRTFHGLWLGGLIGVVLIWVWSNLQGKKRSRAERPRV